MPAYDKADVQRRMHGAVDALKHDLGGLRTGRASNRAAVRRVGPDGDDDDDDGDERCP